MVEYSTTYFPEFNHNNKTYKPVKLSIVHEEKLITVNENPTSFIVAGVILPEKWSYKCVLMKTGGSTHKTILKVLKEENILIDKGCLVRGMTICELVNYKKK